MEDRTPSTNHQAPPQPSVEDLGALIRNNIIMAQQLAHSMLTWCYLREVMNGEAPPPVIGIRVPTPGHEEPLLVERDLAGLDLETLQQILMPLIVAEGMSIVDGCRDQFDMAQRMTHICDALMQAHAPPEEPEPVPGTQPPRPPRQVVANRPGPTVQCPTGQLSGHGEV